nr:MAG TPA: hypothetical protein [Caudoviricetes sp.]
MDITALVYHTNNAIQYTWKSAWRNLRAFSFLRWGTP